MNTKEKYILTICLSIIISIIAIILITFLLLKRFPKLDTNKSSCGLKGQCNGKYNIKKTAQPVKTPYCKNLVDCFTKNTENTEYKTQDFTLTVTDQQQNISNIGCFNIEDIKICCKGFLPVCVSLQYLLAQENYNVYTGETVVFSDTLCRFLPSCFANNNSSPYLLFPIPEFGLNLFTNSATSNYNINVQDANTETVANIGFSSLGVTMLSKEQGIVIALNLPPLNSITYFSLTPYIFSSSRMGSNFSNGILFSSLTDPLNFYDILNILTTEQKNKWQTENITVLIVTTHNKNIATEFCNSIKNININIPPSGFISKLSEEYNISYEALEKIPILCVPIPAGSTFGTTKDPLGRPMLKDSKTNKYIDSSSPIFDYQHDTYLLLGRIVPNNENQDVFDTWKNEISSQSKSVVLGFEKDIEYQAFKLSDQNGYFYKNDNNYWDWTTYSENNIGNWIGSNFKSQTHFNTELTQNDLTTYKNNLIEQFKKETQFDEFVTIETLQVPSPFSQYNDYIVDIYGNDLDKTLWSQIGIELTQFNVATLGDCRDTVYPKSNNFCLGMNDLAVVISENYMVQNTTSNSHILYNTLNLYDTQTVTSFGSLKGNNLNNIYSVGFSRADLTCMQNFNNTSLDSIKFIPTGPHNILAASQDTPFISMNRTYLNVPDNQTDGYTFATSPSPLDLSNYITFICRPCTKKTLDVKFCNDISVSPSGPAAYCSETDICDNNLIHKTNKQIVKYDNITGDLCNKLRNPKSKDQTTILVIASVSGTFAIATFISVMFAIYINISNRESLQFRFNTFYIVLGFVIFVFSTLCIFSSTIWGKRIKNVPSSSYDVAINQSSL